MNPQSAASAYLEASIENAPPVKIVHMLYQGALRFLERAAKCDPNEPSSDFTHWLSRAEAVVSELRVALDSAAAPEVAEQLERLYLFVESEIFTAMTERKRQPIDNARSVLEKLQQAWAEIDVQGTPD
jgi:flagellar protein FliS